MQKKEPYWVPFQKNHYNFSYKKAQITPPISVVHTVQKPTLMAMYLKPLFSNKALTPRIGKAKKMPVRKP